MRKNNIIKIITAMSALGILSACASSSNNNLFETLPGDEKGPLRYSNTGVHDPSIIKGEDFLFMVGSHLDSATTVDYIDYTKYSSGVLNGNPMIPNVQEDMKEALEWARTETFWAGDIIRMKDGKYYFYYSVCEGSSPLSAIGYAVADKVEGPYINQGIIMKSGRSGKLLSYEPDRNIQYDPNVHPNTIDPTVFYDKDDELVMVYGSYSGGIFILKMDEKTKMPIPGQGYGVKITGGKHTRIENPYIHYDQETDYYYFYASFGGLGSGHGYQTRVARSKDLEGPYLDALGQDINDIHNQAQGMFDDATINKYGNKLMGDFEFVNSENKKMGLAYMSPGGASVIYDDSIDKTMLVFHTRFPGKGEAFEIRSHEIYNNKDGWPVVAPLRYSGAQQVETTDDIEGQYQYVIHNLQIIGDMVTSSAITLDKNDSSLNLTNEDHYVSLTLNGTKYEGVALKQWDAKRMTMVKTLSLQGEDNTSLWLIEE